MTAARNGETTMKFERIRSPIAPELGPESLYNCKKAGDHVFISGLRSWDENQNVIGVGDAYLQAKTVFAQMQSLIEAAGGKMNDIAKITMFTTDMRHQPDIWRARREFFTGDLPCSTLVCVSHLFKPEAVIEIEAVGVIGAGED